VWLVGTEGKEGQGGQGGMGLPVPGRTDEGTPLGRGTNNNVLAG
jgi:hypothetical protein